MTRELLIRADADAVRGTGHVMRTLALAQEWRERCGSFTYLGRVRSGGMDRRIAAEGGEVADLVGNADEKRDRGALLQLASRGGWVALDIYFFAAQAEDALRSRACRILSIDDYGARERVSADLLLNQNTSADGIIYDCGPETIPLRGPRFALLRKAFRRELRKLRTEREGGVLVMFGGSDPAGLTARTLSALATLKEPPPVGVAICGSLTIGSENIQRAAARLGSGWSVKMDASDATVAAILSNAQVAVSACGTTIWELAAFGIPTLAFSVAENQRLVLSSLAAIGAVWTAARARTSARRDSRPASTSFAKVPTASVECARSAPL